MSFELAPPYRAGGGCRLVVEHNFVVKMAKLEQRSIAMKKLTVVLVLAFVALSAQSIGSDEMSEKCLEDHFSDFEFDLELDLFRIRELERVLNVIAESCLEVFGIQCNVSNVSDEK